MNCNPASSVSEQNWEHANMQEVNKISIGNFFLNMAGKLRSITCLNWEFSLPDKSIATRK